MSINTNYTDIFTSMGFGTSNSTGGAFSLTDYMGIKNGSYGKLLKAYYKKQDAEEAAAVDETEKKQLSMLKSSADSLKNATLELMDEDLFEKKTNEETGEEEYDWDAITKAVKDFASKYNSVVESAGNSDDNNVLRHGVWLTQMTESNTNLLAKAGISIGGDNKLSVSETALKEANVNTLKTLFTGVNSFADNVVRKASQIGSTAVNSASTSGSAYTNTANYDNLSSGGYLYDELF